MAEYWQGLTNAKHIDAILADVKARPEVWAGMQVASEDLVTAQTAVRSVAWLRRRIGPDKLAYERLWNTVRGLFPTYPAEHVRNSGLSIAWSAILALIAWDDSARMLNMSPAALRTLIDIAEGDVKHQAVLLLPAVIALQGGRA